MSKYLTFAVFAVLLGAFVYLLYCRGIAVSKHIRAVLFFFQPGSGEDRVTVDACTGWVKHAARFRESRRYTFALETHLSKGEVELLLLDRERRQLLRLDRHTPTGTAELDGRSRYFLRWRFQNATGKCELHW